MVLPERLMVWRMVLPERRRCNTWMTQTQAGLSWSGKVQFGPSQLLAVVLTGSATARRVSVQRRPAPLSDLLATEWILCDPVISSPQVQSLLMTQFSRMFPDQISTCDL